LLKDHFSLHVQAAALGALGAYPGGLQLGGGVSTENAVEYLEAGASHVIVTSFVFRDGRLEEARLADLVSQSWKDVFNPKEDAESRGSAALQRILPGLEAGWAAAAAARAGLG